LTRTAPRASRSREGSTIRALMRRIGRSGTV
jgi:hypothetical protein